MRVNREARLISTSLGRANRAGKVLCILFSAAAGFSALFAVLFVGLQIVEGASVLGDPRSALAILYSFLETAVMFAVYLLCAFVAYDVSRGRTPFSRKQIRRVSAAACLMLAFTALSFVWEPLTTLLLISSNALTVGFEGESSSVDFRINFGALVAAGAFFLFSYILSYGKTLQELADETA